MSCKIKNYNQTRRYKNLSSMSIVKVKSGALQISSDQLDVQIEAQGPALLAPPPDQAKPQVLLIEELP